MDLVIEVISGLRNIRSEMNIPPSMELTVEVQAETEEMAILVAHAKSSIRAMRILPHGWAMILVSVRRNWD